MRNNKTSFFNHTTNIWTRLPPSLTIILLIGSVNVLITDLHCNLPCLNPHYCQARQSGSEVRLVVFTFITLNQGCLKSLSHLITFSHTFSYLKASLSIAQCLYFEYIHNYFNIFASTISQVYKIELFHAFEIKYKEVTFSMFLSYHFSWGKTCIVY